MDYFIIDSISNDINDIEKITMVISEPLKHSVS
jgi:hypothetical protein